MWFDRVHAPGLVLFSFTTTLFGRLRSLFIIVCFLHVSYILPFNLIALMMRVHFFLALLENSSVGFDGSSSFPWVKIHLPTWFCLPEIFGRITSMLYRQYSSVSSVDFNRPSYGIFRHVKWIGINFSNLLYISAIWIYVLLIQEYV